MKNLLSCMQLPGQLGDNVAKIPDPEVHRAPNIGLHIKSIVIPPKQKRNILHWHGNI